MAMASFGTGVLDAVTYIGMDKVFGANMTGNVILIGIAMTGSQGIPAAGPAAALGGFVLGSWLVGQIARRVPRVTGDRVASWLFGGAALGMLGVATTLAFGPSSATFLHGVTAVIGIVMAIQAVAARRVGVPDVSTIVVTSTLSLLFTEMGSRGGGADGVTTRRRLMAVCSMLLGASVGGMVVAHGLWIGVAISGVLLAAVAGTWEWCTRNVADQGSHQGGVSIGS